MFCAKKSLTVDDKKSKKENLNLADLDLKKFKLSDEDALALSYLTPGLSRRIQKHLLSHLAPSEVQKLHRTLSSDGNNSYDKDNQKYTRRSVDRLSSTLPRRYCTENKNQQEKEPEPNVHPEVVYRNSKSGLPVKLRDDSRTVSLGYETDFSYKKPRATRSVSLREPKNYSYSNKDKSPESSLSESLSRNDERKEDYSPDSYSSLSRPSSYSKYSDSSTLNKYLTPMKTFDANGKTEIKKPSSSPRRISRFLRPDFFDTPKEESPLVKEKKEREMETQKVLKEIRDKRKCRLRRERSSSRDQERSVSREKSIEKIEEEKKDPSKLTPSSETDGLLNNVSNNIKNLENNVKTLHDYINVTAQNTADNKETENKKEIHDYVNVKVQKPEDVPVVKKTRISKLVRPKSYPNETTEKEKVIKVSPEKESKISRLRKGFTRQGSKERDKTKEDKNETNKSINEEEKGHKNKLLQSIEKKLEKFRSSSSSVKDSDESKSSKDKKSGVESAIKRLREQSLPRNIEPCTESGLIKRAVSVEDVSNLSSSNKPLQASRKSVTKILGLFKKYEEQDKKNDKVSKKKKVKDNNNKNPDEAVIQNNKSTEPNVNCNDSSQTDEVKPKPERPRSLLLDKMKQFQTGAKTDSVANEKEAKGGKTSKLPVNSFRRSLNLENVTVDVPKPKPERNLKLDLSKIPKNCEPSTSLNHDENNRNSVTTDDSSAFLSPDDISGDSWSVCSDYHTQELHSPVSPNGYSCDAGEENESVIDRIRRKSFYTRFNEKKRPRKPSMTRMDLYKEPTFKTPADYAASYDYKTPLTRRSTFASQDPVKREYKNYTRSSSLLNDYVNVPNRYQTYNAKVSRPTTSIYSDSEDNTTLDEFLTAAKSRKYSSPMQPSTLSNRGSVSPVNEQFYFNRPTSSVTSPTSSEPV